MDSNKRRSFYVDFKFIAYRQDCQQCDEVAGEVDFDEDEEERLMRIASQLVLENLGLKHFEQKERQRFIKFN